MQVVNYNWEYSYFTKEIVQILTIAPLMWSLVYVRSLSESLRNGSCSTCNNMMWKEVTALKVGVEKGLFLDICVLIGLIHLSQIHPYPSKE